MEDNSDSAIVAGMWVKRNIGQLLTVDFIFFPDRFFAMKAGINLAHHSILGYLFPVRGPLRLLLRYDSSALFIAG